MTSNCVELFRIIYARPFVSIDELVAQTDWPAPSVIYILRNCRACLLECITDNFVLIGELVDHLGGNHEAMDVVEFFFDYDEGDRLDTSMRPCLFSSLEISEFRSNSTNLANILRFYENIREFL